MSIVVGYLDTAEGRAALAAAADEARLRTTDVVVVVSRRPDEQEPTEAGLAPVRELLTTAGVQHEVRVLDGGDAAEDLIATAEDTGAQLLVIGLRQRSPVGKLILGVNAQRVLFDAPCPVLTVRPGTVEPFAPRV